MYIISFNQTANLGWLCSCHPFCSWKGQASKRLTMHECMVRTGFKPKTTWLAACAASSVRLPKKADLLGLLFQITLVFKNLHWAFDVKHNISHTVDAQNLISRARPVASCAIIFSHSEGCLFTLFLLSFAVQKLLRLIRSHFNFQNILAAHKIQY